jgi:hypothetical protein
MVLKIFQPVPQGNGLKKEDPKELLSDKDEMIAKLKTVKHSLIVE